MAGNWRRLVAAFVLGAALFTTVPVWGQDLNTLLVQFLSDLRNGTLGVSWGNLASITFDNGLSLVEDADNVLAQRDGTNGQTFRVYNTYSSSGTNYERIETKFVSNNPTIAFVIGGTGSNRNMVVQNTTGLLILRGTGYIFQSETGATDFWSISTAGHLLGGTDNTYSIGADGATRPKDYFGAGRFTHNNRATVTVDGVTTFAVTSSYTVLACTGAETINTITGGVTGMRLVLEHTDSECTIADDDAATAANAVDLTGTGTNDVGAAKKFIELLYNGTDWVQVSESDN